MNLSVLKTTAKWKDFWVNRKIDWEKDYTSTWEHPHRYVISALLTQFPWVSLYEIGCGSGPNLINIVKNHPNKQLGGMDVSPTAIAAAAKSLQGAHLKVGSVEDIMMSDYSTDIVLSDMCLIYVDPRKIDQAIGEMVRICRKRLVLCEFHSTSWWERLKLKFTSGYNAYDYVKLLEKHGCYDIVKYKITPQMWPGGEPQKTFGYLITAKVSKRK